MPFHGTCIQGMRNFIMGAAPVSSGYHRFPRYAVPNDGRFQTVLAYLGRRWPKRYSKVVGKSDEPDFDGATVKF
jgi:hypothetical protein